MCEKCHQREAVVKFTQVIGNKKTTLNLCKVCAEKEGLTNPMLDISKVFGKLIIAVLSEHLMSELTQQSEKENEARVCNNCGLSWADFTKTGRLGCPECYETFAKELKILTRRIHGSNKHIGNRLPVQLRGKKESVISLKKKLQDAIKKEEYELAAELRDRIREIEGGN